MTLGAGMRCMSTREGRGGLNNKSRDRERVRRVDNLILEGCGGREFYSRFCCQVNRQSDGPCWLNGYGGLKRGVALLGSTCCSRDDHFLIHTYGLPTLHYHGSRNVRLFASSGAPSCLRNYSKTCWSKVSSLFPQDTFTASAPSALLSASTWGMHRRVWLAILPAVQNRPKLLILHLGKHDTS